MKTDQSKLQTPAITTSQPEVTTPPQRSGVLGTILTELAFGEDEQAALKDCEEALSEHFEFLVTEIATRARQVALDSELYGANALAPTEQARASIRNLRRHAARQWLTATLSGEFDVAFSRQLRHTWMPILFAEKQQTRATGAAIGAFLDYFEGFVASYLVDGIGDNLVPAWRQLHAFRTALDVQRRVFGLPCRA